MHRPVRLCERDGRRTTAYVALCVCVAQQKLALFLVAALYRVCVLVLSFSFVQLHSLAVVLLAGSISWTHRYLLQLLIEFQQVGSAICMSCAEHKYRC